MRRKLKLFQITVERSKLERMTISVSARGKGHAVAEALHQAESGQADYWEEVLDERSHVYLARK